MNRLLEVTTVSVIVTGATVLLEIISGVNLPLMILTKSLRVLMLFAGIIVTSEGFSNFGSVK